MATSKAGANVSGDGSAPDTGVGQAAPICTVGFCPLCLAVTAVQPLGPEAVEHLLNAGRELLLAAREVLDLRAKGVSPDVESTRLEKIDIG